MDSVEREILDRMLETRQRLTFMRDRKYFRSQVIRWITVTLSALSVLPDTTFVGFLEGFELAYATVASLSGAIAGFLLLSATTVKSQETINNLTERVQAINETIRREAEGKWESAKLEQVNLHEKLEVIHAKLPQRSYEDVDKSIRRGPRD